MNEAKNTLKAILDHVCGTWHVRANHSVLQFKETEMHRAVSHGSLAEWTGIATVSRADDTIMFEYSLKDAIAETSTVPITLDYRLCYNKSQQTVGGFFFDTNETHGRKAFAFPQSLYFASDFRESCIFWSPYARMFKDLSVQPLLVSMAFQKVTERSWLLDVCFSFPPEENATQEMADLQLIRSQYWHFPVPVSRTAATVELDLLDNINETIQSIDDAETDIGFAHDELEDLMSAVETAKDRLTQKTKTLEKLRKSAADAADDVTQAGDEFSDAMLEQHLEIARHGVDSLDSLDDGSVNDALEALGDLESDVEWLNDDVSDVGDDIDGITEDVIAAHWTSHGYASARRLLNKLDGNVVIDVSFLGAFQDYVDRLSDDSQKMVRTALGMLQLYRANEILAKYDCSPVISSMAKCCERIFADAFEKRKAVVLGHPIVQDLFVNAKKWNFFIPTELSHIEKTNLCNAINVLKKEPFKWHGTRNCGYATLLFGGYIKIEKDGRIESLDLFGNLDANEKVRDLPMSLIEFQEHRNGFIHHDLATLENVITVSECFKTCLCGLLGAFYADT